MDAKHRDPEWLREKYHGDGLGVRRVADKADVTTRTIKKWMGRLGIETRDGPSKEGPHRDRNWLEECYWDNLMSMAEMAEEAGVSVTQIKSWMDRLGVETRDAHESVVARGSLRRSNNPAWNGGYSLDDDWRLGQRWHETRRAALRRDDGACQMCGEDGRVVHHVTPVSEGGPKYELDNLLTLCRGCHTEVHT